MAYSAKTEEELKEIGKTKKRMEKGKLFAYTIALPAIVIVLLVNVYPFFYSLWMSFHKIDAVKKTNTFVWFGNYIKIAGDEQVLNSVFVTVWFAIVVVASTILLGIGIAYLLNQNFKGRTILRTLLVLPWAISEIINGLIWQFMYSSQFGVINSLLLSLGLIQEKIGFMAQGFTALNLVALAYIWNQAPLGAILILAALQAVPRDELDSGLVDGANAIQRFRHIVFPYLRPTILIVLLLFTFNAFRQFDLIFIMTTGGPGTATSTMSWYSYTITFKYFKFGYGAAVAWLLSLISVVIAMGYMKVMYKKGEEVF